MNKTDLERWQAIEDEFLNSDLAEAAFCKSRKLNLDWFRKKLREAEQKPEDELSTVFSQVIELKTFEITSMRP